LSLGDWWLAPVRYRDAHVDHCNMRWWRRKQQSLAARRPLHIEVGRTPTAGAGDSLTDRQWPKPRRRAPATAASMLRKPLPTAYTSNGYRQQYYDAPSPHRMSHSDEPASRLACQLVEQTGS
jgi:hypothetical protein